MFEDELGSLAFTPDGKFLLGLAGESVNVWEVARQAFLPRIDFYGNHDPQGMACFADGTRLLVGPQRDERDFRRLHVVELPGGKILSHVEVAKSEDGYIHQGSHVPGLEFSRDGSRFNVGFSAWDAKTGRILLEVLPDRFEAEGFHHYSSARISPDGNSIVGYGDRAEQLMIWDLKTDSAVAAFQHAAGVNDLAFSPDGSLLASTDGDLIHIWDFDARKRLANLVGHVNRVREVVFSPSGKELVSVSDDCTVRLWDVSTIIPVRPKREEPSVR
jgi:WD40 repeat protein